MQRAIATPHKTSDAPSRLRLRMRVTEGDAVAIGPAKVALLEAVRTHGSITAAAKTLDLSYRRAWAMVDELNRSLRTPAVTSAQGGSGGGGSVLTPAGEKVLRLYRAIEDKAFKACAADMARLVAMLPGR